MQLTPEQKLANANHARSQMGHPPIVDTGYRAPRSLMETPGMRRTLGMSDDELWAPLGGRKARQEPKEAHEGCQEGKCSHCGHERRPRPPRSRDSRPAPTESRQYARAMSTQVARDARLTPNAVKLAFEIVAAAGDRGFVGTTRFALAEKVNLSIRTVARLLAELRRYGYIATERLVGPQSGMDTGLVVFVLEPLRPYYQQGKAFPGVTKAASNKDQKINHRKEEQASCQIRCRLGIPRSVWEANRAAYGGGFKRF